VTIRRGVRPLFSGIFGRFESHKQLTIRRHPEAALGEFESDAGLDFDALDRIAARGQRFVRRNGDTG